MLAADNISQNLSFMVWRAVECGEYIDLRETLFSGQVFHFREVGEDEYMGVLGGTLISLRQGPEGAMYLDNHPSTGPIVERFFNLRVDVELEARKRGLRFLTNDFYPAVFSFICSSNNNIKRITKMVEHLYSHGEHVGGGFHAFPGLEELVGIEDELRKNKFGYRARYVCDAARFLLENRVEWERLGYEDARNTLMRIRGVGRKVADCICLMSLGQFHVVPIDTHILKYSTKLFNLEPRGLSAGVYDAIQKMWVERFGRYAGVAQLYAFKEYVDGSTRRKLA